VLRFGEFSTELCGGTHVDRVGDIGLMRITHEGGVAAGVRRIEAVTGQGALDHIAATEAALHDKVAQLADRAKTLEKQIDALKSKLATGGSVDLAAQAIDVGGVKVLAARLDGADAKALSDAVDKMKDKLKSAAIVLAAVDGAKVQLAAGVTSDSTARVKAGDLVNFVAQQVGGKGGGKPDLAMAGGTDAAKLPQALASVRAWVAERL